MILLPSLIPFALTATSPVTTRLAERRDLVPLARLVEASFAAGRYADDEPTFHSSRRRGWFETQETMVRVGLDIERRMTPWDWCRHAQIVAESGDQIVGFCEVWGEDASALNNVSATNPQPVLFNLCVSSDARRRGVAKALLQRCEEETLGWGDDIMYLKVRDDNEAACRLYEVNGWELIETRTNVEMSAWMEKWKGGKMPLRVMVKALTQSSTAAAAAAVVSLEEAAAAAEAQQRQQQTTGAILAELETSDSPQPMIPAKSFDEFEVTLQSVLQYDDKEAVIWFVLLVLRNVQFLSPSYRVLPGLFAFIVWGLYYLVIRVLSHPEIYGITIPALS